MVGINRTTGKATDLITFSRASGGTALRKISYGSELVTNGTFDTDLTGTTPATWETNNANASLVKQSDGTALFTSTNFAYARIQFASRPVLPVGVYQVSFEISEWVAGLSLVHVGLGASGNNVGGNGSYSYLFTSTVEQAYEFQIRPNGGGTGSFKIDNISVKEVLFDQPDGTLTLFNHPNNIPRIEYAADGTVKGLLIEEQRVNLLTYSEDFTNAYWVKASSSVTGGVIGPDGTASAYDLNGLAGAGESRLDLNVTVSTSTAYTFSTFAKRDQMDWVALAAIGFTTPGNAWAHFDLLNGTTGIVDAGLSASIQDFGNGWYRCSITFTTDAVDTSGSLRIHIAEGDGDRLLTDEALSSVLVYGAQFEAGSFPTSYIPTSGSPATRAADIASISVDSFGYRQDAGTVVVEADTFSTAVNNHQDFNLIAPSAPSANSIHSGSRVGGGVAGQYAFWVQSGGSTVVFISKTSVISDNTVYKSAWTASENDFALTVNGQSVVTDTSGVMPSAATEARIGYGTYGRINGHIKSIAYYPRRLSNAQLQELTA